MKQDNKKAKWGGGKVDNRASANLSETREEKNEKTLVRGGNQINTNGQEKMDKSVGWGGGGGKNFGTTRGVKK